MGFSVAKIVPLLVYVAKKLLSTSTYERNESVQAVVEYLVSDYPSIWSSRSCLALTSMR